jgi:Protein of unknown function (DUF3800)
LRGLIERKKQQTFLNEINEIIEQAPFTVIAAVIDKSKLRQSYQRPINPYHIAVEFCQERLKFFLDENRAASGLVHVVFESRGRNEDDELELEFRRVCAENRSGCVFPFEPVFARKGANSTGLQLADLIARPIGRHVGAIEGYGLKCFP